MKKVFFSIVLFLYLSFSVFIIPSMAQPQNYREGVYKIRELNLVLDTPHSIKNNSNTEYAFIMIFDSNQIAQQLMQLKPNSKEYVLVPLQPEYQILIVTNEEITIT